MNKQCQQLQYLCLSHLLIAGKKNTLSGYIEHRVPVFNNIREIDAILLPQFPCIK